MANSQENSPLQPVNPSPMMPIIELPDAATIAHAPDGSITSEDRLKIIAAVSADAIYDWDINTGMTRWNHGMRTLFGYPVDDEQAHLWWREQVHPDDRQHTVESIEDALANRDRIWTCEYRYRRADDSYAHVLDRGYVIYDAEGRPLRMIGAMVDATDRILLAEAQTRAALEERQRLARDLHDAVTQSLYSLTLLAEAARRWAAAGNLAQVETHLGRLGETAQQSLKEMRLLVYELRPAALEKEGLVGALQQRLDAVEERAGVNARLLVEGLLDLPPATEESLYRLAQEALNNALKHAGATAVTVRLQTTAAGVTLQISDNGQGLSSERLEDKGGMGLNNIRERAERLGGQARIESQTGKGTTVHVFVPGEVLP
jgi:PAS domain S-box-containing protein